MPDAISKLGSVQKVIAYIIFLLDSCDSNQQSIRDDLFISAFCITIIILLTFNVVLIILFNYKRKPHKDEYMYNLKGELKLAANTI